MIHLEILRGLRAAVTTAARYSPLNKFAPILRSNSPAMADSFPSAKHASDRLEDSAAWGWRRTTATPPGPWSAPTWGWRAGSTDQRPVALGMHRRPASPGLPGPRTWGRSGSPGWVEERQKMHGNGSSPFGASENADAHEPLHRQQADHETDPAVNDALHQTLTTLLL